VKRADTADITGTADRAPLAAPRLSVSALTPGTYRAMAEFGRVAEEGLDPVIANLVKIRASQVNGCAFCVDLHTRQARAAGETEQRLYALPAWQAAPFFGDRERAALALTEAVTAVSEGRVPDEVYAAAASRFDQRELAQLLWTVAAINAWNRIAVSTGMTPPAS